MNRIKKTSQIVELRTDTDNPERNPVLKSFYWLYQLREKTELTKNLYLYIFNV